MKTAICILLWLGTMIPGLAQDYSGKKKDIEKILKKIDQFSNHYIQAEYQKLAECYTQDGKIFPDGTQIIEGIEAIEKRWMLPENIKILKHRIQPLEIKVIKKYAYDYGTYAGRTLNANGDKIDWRGKYVIVWRKVNNDWKIYLDIWNRIE